MTLPEAARLWHLPRPLLQEQTISGKSLILQYNTLLDDEVETHGAARP
jgi:hypothetical protein